MGFEKYLLEISNNSRLANNKTRISKKLKNGIEQTIFNLLDEKIAKSYSKESGLYYCLTVENFLFNQDMQEKLSKEITKTIKKLIKTSKLKINSVLIIGLGNRNMIADSLGVKVIDKIVVTRHVLKREGIKHEFLKQVSAFSTGIFATTGIESAEISKGVCEQICPDLIIVVDSLVANSQKYLSRSVQISNTGIEGGKGVNNTQKAINRELLSVPVFSIGVPLLIRSSNLDNAKENSDNETIVCLKDIDECVRQMSKVISKAINNTFNPQLSTDKLDSLFYN